VKRRTGESGKGGCVVVLLVLILLVLVFGAGPCLMAGVVTAGAVGSALTQSGGK